MTPKQFIANAIDRGVQEGLTSLSQLEAFVFLISEAEIDCDIDGIDTFLELCGKDEVLLAAEAFQSVGAMEIAEGLNRIGIRLPDVDEPEFSRTNSLITERVGYDYEAVERMVASRLV